MATENNNGPVLNDADRQTIEIERQRKLIADFLEVEPAQIAFTWDVVHWIFSKLAAIDYGIQSLNEEKNRRKNELALAMAGNSLADCFDLLDVACDRHLSLFKKSALKRD